MELQKSAHNLIEKIATWELQASSAIRRTVKDASIPRPAVRPAWGWPPTGHRAGDNSLNQDFHEILLILGNL
jgi:hypothetical protein